MSQSESAILPEASANANEGLVIGGSREYASEVQLRAQCGMAMSKPWESANGVRPPLHKLSSEVDIASNVSRLEKLQWCIIMSPKS
jgi:hypothetical protein